MLTHFFSSQGQEPRRRQGSSTYPLSRRVGASLRSGTSGWFALLPAALLLTGCAAAPAPPAPDRGEPPGQESVSEAPDAPTADQPGSAEAVDPELINPRVTDFEARLPPRLLGIDAIAPVYDPVFATADEAQVADEELVIGIELEGEAKAYPITVLRFREMVNDELAGWPILVTW